MILLTTQQKSKPWTRRVFGLFVVVWLNMALQPCAIAFGDADDHGCPGCPPTSTEEISSHSTHEAGDSDLNASMCATGTAQCAYFDDFNYGGRATSAGAEDESSDLPVGIAPSVDAISIAKNSSVDSDVCDTFYLPGDSPPLNILYCVYLI